ncbi:MAG: hypothetical protein LBV50_10120 [Novosphingobium sp.]|jgi:Meckel syndrome type 1 protein|nr:hypothetical protein [Novosphingobium sp.]
MLYGVAMRRIPASFPALALLLPLTACAAGRDYPSLEPRPAERAGGTARPVAPEAPPAPPPPPSPQFTARLSQLLEQARTGHERFTGKRTAAEKAVAAGGSDAPGSEGWAVATATLSALESARSDTGMAMAELDQLYAAETIAASETGDYGKVTAIVAAREHVTALIVQQDDILARLRGRMRD